MEYITSLLKALVVLPVGALIEAPFILLGARVVLRRRPSFGAAYILALITGVALILASIVLWPILASVNEVAGSVISIVASLLVPTIAYGYLLTNEQGASVGYVKGGKVVLFSQLMFGVALVSIAFLGGWLSYVLHI